MQDCNPIDTSIAKGKTLSQNICPRTRRIWTNKKNPLLQHCWMSYVRYMYMRKIPYSSVVGYLMYAIMYTRPEICYAISLVSYFQSNPGPKHCKAVKKKIEISTRHDRFLLMLSRKRLCLLKYTNVDWGGIQMSIY